MKGTESVSPSNPALSLSERAAMLVQLDEDQNMLISVDYPISGGGVPKHHSERRHIEGTVSGKFSIAESNEPMVHTITLKSPHSEKHYFQNGDGHSYIPSTWTGEIADGQHFKATYDASGNPFAKPLIQEVVRVYRDKSRSDVTSNYYPKTLHPENRYGSTLMLNIENTVIHDFRSGNMEHNYAKVQELIDGHIVVNGKLFIRVPEPVYVIISDSDRNVTVDMWYPEDQAGLAKLLRNTPKAVAFFNIGNYDFAEEFAREMAADIRGQFQNPRQQYYNVDKFDQLTSYGDSFSLYVLAKRMRAGAVDCLSRGAEKTIVAKMTEWNGDPISTLSNLSNLIETPDWFDRVDELDRVVSKAFALEEGLSNKLFTHNFPGADEDKRIDFRLAFSQWQMRTIHGAAYRL